MTHRMTIFHPPGIGWGGALLSVLLALPQNAVGASSSARGMPIGAIPVVGAHRGLAPSGVQRFPADTQEARDLAVTLSQPHIDALLERARSGPGDALRVKRVGIDPLGMAHVHLQQLVGGVPVFQGEAIVHLEPDGALFGTTDDLRRRVTVDARARLSPADAVDLALDEYGCRGCLTAPPKVDAWILRHEGRDHLVFRVRLQRLDGTDATAMPVLFIDARSGALLWHYDDLQSGTGVSLYSGSVEVGTSYGASNYYLEDLNRRIGTFDNRNTDSTSATHWFVDEDDLWESSSQQAGVDAHFGAAAFWDFFYEHYGRLGIDGQGGPLKYSAATDDGKLISAIVHFGSSYNNAFWNGEAVFFGDGDGTVFSPLVALDVVAHEMTHGITQYTAGLTGYGEPGALNESMSDVFGAMVERSITGETAGFWRTGEACYTPQNGTSDAIRYLDDPHQAADYGFTADDDPDHYLERYAGPEDDNGEHINAGIPNKVFYLLANGGTHHLGGSMTGIGPDAAADIWYLALTSYMTSGTRFVGARDATLSAAAALYGEESLEQDAVAQAWGLCGVERLPGWFPPVASLLLGG